MVHVKTDYAKIILTAIYELLQGGDNHITIYKLERVTGLNRGNIYKFFKKLQINKD